ncbi:MAG: hypothetical protein JOZ48_04615 [Acidobacteriaceae bacterium]|nr:hypothetical protein [Acidobacteriaceae bacterium]
MQTEVPREALVLRFKPMIVETVWKKACLTYRLNGRYQLSVFADVARLSEGEDDLIKRLLNASERQGVAPANNPRYFLCTEAAKLLDLGFTFWKDGPPEVDEHYSVDLGEDATVGHVERFVAAFDRDGRR